MNRVYVIAEAGVNHNGDIALAKRLIDEAKNAGADAVKFQSFVADEMVSSFAPKAEYQKKSTASNENQLEMLRKLQLTYNDHVELIDYCHQKLIQFLSTPFDLSSVAILEKLGVPLYKISSGDITNLPLLEAVGACRKPVIISSGMSNMEEINQAVESLRENGATSICVLHCNTEYPTPYCDVNLRAMLTIKNQMNVKVGYSDHTEGICVPIAAVALGAEVIEKHFTLDKSMSGPDHKASLEPDELAQMISEIRNVEKCLGTAEKAPTESEKKNIIIARKSIVASKDIAAGEMFTKENITVKRPGGGISPMNYYAVLDQPAKRNFIKDEYIEL